MAKTEPNPVGRAGALDSSTNPVSTSGTASEAAAPTRAPVPTAAQAPSVGRIVHYQPEGDGERKPRAGIITDVGGDGRVSLRVFPPHGESVSVRDVPFAAGPKPGSWNWPPRV